MQLQYFSSKTFAKTREERCIFLLKNETVFHFIVPCSTRSGMKTSGTHFSLFFRAKQTAQWSLWDPDVKEHTAKQQVPFLIIPF